MKLTIPIFRLWVGFVRSETEKFQVQIFIQLDIKNLTFLPVSPPLCMYHLAVIYIHKASDSVATMCPLEKNITK